MSGEKHSKWFESWFNSPYYHILYKNRNCDEAAAFVENLIGYLKPKKNSRFLDLACGKGRHSLFLNKKGFDVTGIDLSPESIRLASQCENEHLHFYVHDMRKLFRTNYFDYVLNLFTSFGYFEDPNDDLATINTVYKALKPDGVFVLDFFNASKVIRNLKPEYIFKVEGIEFCIRKKLENGFIQKSISFTDKGKDYLFEERVKALSLADFERYFAANQLKIVHLWGDYNLNPYNSETSDRLILVARKD